MSGSTITCPLCKEGKMNYEPIDNPKGLSQDINGKPTTHVWICEDCPSVVMEWYDSTDTDVFYEKMNVHQISRKSTTAGDIIKQDQALQFEMDRIEENIKRLMPSIGNESWVARAEKSTDRSIQILFQEYRRLHSEAIALFYTSYMKVNKE